MPLRGMKFRIRKRPIDERRQWRVDEYCGHLCTGYFPTWKEAMRYVAQQIKQGRWV